MVLSEYFLSTQQMCETHSYMWMNRWKENEACYEYKLSLWLRYVKVPRFILFCFFFIPFIFILAIVSLLYTHSIVYTQCIKHENNNNKIIIVYDIVNIASHVSITEIDFYTIHELQMKLYIWMFTLNKICS